MPFFSIQLNSNRPKQIVTLFDNIEATADRPSDIEVLLHIDTGDTVMERLVADEQKRRQFILRILQTDLVKGYATLWKPLNPLWEMTDPNAYFVINISDEFLFQTQGWDTIVRRYEGYYPDHIFRLRASKYRFRNYTDFWECGFAPDSLAFYTRRWLELSGDWNPCLGPDSFQQCVAFYLFTSDPFSHTQYNRDIPLTELRFAGEGAGIGLEGRAKYKQIIINNHAWFILMSHRMQQEARRRAMRMKSHIIAHAAGGLGMCEVTESLPDRHFTILSQNDRTEIARVSYRLSWTRISLTNVFRMRHVLYYAGGGKRALKYPAFGLFLMITTYLPRGADALNWLMETRQKVERIKSRPRRYLRRIADICGDHVRKCRERARKEASCEDALVAVKYVVLPIPVGPALLQLATRLYAITLRMRRMISPHARHVLMPVKSSTKPWTGLLRQYIGKHLKSIPTLQVSIPYPQRIAYRLKCILIRSLRATLMGCFNCLEGARNSVRNARTYLRSKHRNRSVVGWQRIDNGVPPPQEVQAKRTVFSIQLSSNRPHNIPGLLDNIELMSDDPARVEVLLHIDAGDSVMKMLLEREQSVRRVRLRYIETRLMTKFTDLWKAANALFQITDPEAYFVAFISDEMRFETKGWDTQLMEYIGYYPDHLFRVRASKYRFRNYTDYWECGFAPDSLAFYTRPWLASQGDWNPCTGPDSFQQCVSFYLFRSDPYSHVQYHRDIAAPFIMFSGEGASVGLEGEAKERRIRENNREWFVLMSHPMQEEAKRRAMHLKAAMICKAHVEKVPQEPLMVLENRETRQIRIEQQDGTLVDVLSYRLSRLGIRLTTLLRAPLVHYYAGGGIDTLKAHPWNGMRMMINTFSPTGRRLLAAKDRLGARWAPSFAQMRHRRNHVVGTWKHHGFLRGTRILLRNNR